MWKKLHWHNAWRTKGQYKSLAKCLMTKCEKWISNVGKKIGVNIWDETQGVNKKHLENVLQIRFNWTDIQ